MIILGIETSCDETGVAVVENGTKILANSLATSMDMHVKSGGIIPENAAREQVKLVIPTLQNALEKSGCDPDDIDALAVTYGPGLIGSLLVGVETAKALSFSWNKPLIPVNHLYGHIYSAWLENPTPPQFPCIVLIVSGGHTDILLMSDHGHERGNRVEWLGGTRDDAAGEAFDKTARLLGLAYPGGPAISKLAQKSGGGQFKLPRPMIHSGNLEMSFSGLKTAVLTIVKGKNLNEGDKADLAWEIEEAITDLLVTKTINAAKSFHVNEIILGGGVSANPKLRQKMSASFTGKVTVPPPEYSTDNGAMIASAAFFNNQPVPWKNVTANPSLHYS